MSEPEILVHAAAPSRGSDDARYRKEAVAILQFEAVKRHSVFPRKIQRDETERGIQDRIPQDAREDLNQDSVTSTDHAPLHHLPDSLTTWVTPILTRPSPQLLIGRTPVPSFYQRSSARSENFQIKRTPADQYRPRTAPSAPVAIQETPRLRHTLSDSFETPPSVIPDSQPVLPLQDRNKRPLEENSSPSPTHQQSPSAKRAKVNEVEGLEEWTQPDDTSTPPLNNLPQPVSLSSTKSTSISSYTPSSPNLPAQQLPIKHTPPPPPPAIYEDQPPRYRYRRRQADAPRPKPGNKRPETHLTEPLLSVRKATTRILSTVQPRRPLDTWERGHWRFSIPEDDIRWTRKAKEEMWGCLRGMIQAGSAGWNVWAVFDERVRGGDAGGGGEDQVGVGEVEVEEDGNCSSWQEYYYDDEGYYNDGRWEGRVKVYCWGEVVPEIWAVLVTASGRRVKRCGARWIDAGGEVVVNMDG